MSIQRILSGQFSAHGAAGGTAQAEPAAETLTRVFVRDLVLEGQIGVYDSEHGRQQRIRFNVDLQVRLPAAAMRADQLGQVLSYEDVVNGIKALLADGHVGLVETLAERIADQVMIDPRVALARIGVEKLDVFPGASVGVEIERRAPAVSATVQPLLRVLSGA
jgi:dihydroneopterin aldolase